MSGPDLFLVRLADRAPLFENGRDLHSNVWLLVAAYPTNSDSYALDVAVFTRDGEGMDREPSHGPQWVNLYLMGALLWRRAVSRPPPPLDQVGRIVRVLLRESKDRTKEEAAYVFGDDQDVAAFLSAADEAGAFLDASAECPALSPLVAETSLHSGRASRWIGQVHQTIREARPSALLILPAVPLGVEVYVLDFDPWEASALAIEILRSSSPAGGQDAEEENPAEPDATDKNADRKILERLAIAALLIEGPNATRIAQSIGVKRTTMLGWPTFREQYDKAKNQRAEEREARRRRLRNGELDEDSEDGNDEDE